MGQQLAVPTGYSCRNEGFSYPQWFYPKFEVKPVTIAVCRSTIAAFTNGDMAVYQRIQKFDSSVSPLDFMFRQLFHRLFIVSPTFIRKSLNIQDEKGVYLRATDILKTDFARNFFNDIITESCNQLSSCATLEKIDNTYNYLMTYYNKAYGIDAYLYADLGTVILQVLSDCIGEAFVKSCAAWVNVLSKGLQTLLDLKLTQNDYGSFSLRETMLSLNQPYIEWSDGILSTGYHPIDRQHEWLLTIEPSLHVLIHVNTGNQADICIFDVLDALSDYVWIHFTDEETIFMNHPYPCCYPQFAVHKKQHDEFLERLTSFKKDAGKKPEAVLGKELLDYCINWLTNHIRVTDKLMISCCIPPEELKNNNVFLNTSSS